ncbi:putative membrane protein [Paenibacillus polymyxa]|nr:putative membrane protein [Paenibacillus polymyxa]
MKFYDNRGAQMVVVLLYPVITFVILSNSLMIGSWTVPAIIAILFCLLWKNTLYVIISNILMWIVSVPMWWLLVERVKTDQGAETFISSLPFIILLYIFAVLLPEISIVLFRHYIFNKFRRRNSK